MWFSCLIIVNVVLFVGGGHVGSSVTCMVALVGSTCMLLPVARVKVCGPGSLMQCLGERISVGDQWLGVAGLMD